jgi:hypothetical protein
MKKFKEELEKMVASSTKRSWKRKELLDAIKDKYIEMLEGKGDV